MSFNLYDYLSSRLDLKEVGNGEWVACCPKCADYKLRFYINVETEKGHCHNCDWNLRDAVGFVMFFESLKYKQALNFIKQQPLYIDSEYDLDEGYRQLVYGGKMKKWNLRTDPLPESAWPQFAVALGPKIHWRWENNELVLKAIEYLKNRKVGDLTMGALGMHVIIYGQKLGRIAIPVYKDGKIYSWIFRDFIGNSPKVINDKGAHQRYLLYNWDYASKKDVIVVVEGVFDAIRVGSSAVASFGKKLSDNQLDLLARGNFKRIIMLYDADAKQGILKACKKLSERDDVTANIHVVFLEKADPGDTPHDKLVKLIRNAPVWNTYDSFTDYKKACKAQLAEMEV